MNQIRILNRQEIMKCLSLRDVINGVEKAFEWKAKDLTETFAMVFHAFDNGTADIDIKSGHLKPAHMYGMKLVSFFEDNCKHQQPPLSAVINLFDDETGYPIGVLEGSCITGLRTSAAAAVAAKHLARKDSQTLLIVGAGHQCMYQAAAMLKTMPNLNKVWICDPLDEQHAIAKAETIAVEMEQELRIKLSSKIVFAGVTDLQEAVKTSDVIVTITPSRKPLIQREWVKPGTHFSCIGSDMSGKQELDPQILKDARVFTDDTAQCQNVGEIELAWKQGIIDGVEGELGEVIAEQKTGRIHEEDITVFDSTGIAIQDLIAAQLAFQKAAKKNIGTIAEL